jgi:hypothetical protein
VDDRVLPFADIYCDRVAAVARPAMRRSGTGTDEEMGRALAKVLAHELTHIITKSQTHGKAGVAGRSLSGRQLVDDETTLEPDDLDRIRDGLRQ